MNSKIALSLAASLSLLACSSGHDTNFGGGDLDDIYVYRPNSPYAQVLADCVRAEELDESCTLASLPTIGLETTTPSIETVMERVVVSHDWMGANFEALLAELPDDMLHLMQGVTAVVIDADIRPSFYWNLTGAIYLDPDDLWLTTAEASVISSSPDYRHAFSDPMAFRSFWRWTRDGNELPSSGTDAQGARPLADIILPMASLLYHELAHANDLMPATAYDQLDMNDTIYIASAKLQDSYPSTLLQANSRPNSNEMYHLAEILYIGTTPSTADTQTTAAQVGSFFEPDVASDDYAYVSQYEDLAMLFEEAMMKLRFNVDRDTAFVTPTAVGGEPNYCDTFVIGWGQRNRVGDLEVLTRAEEAVAMLLPQLDLSEELAALPLPTPLPTGTGWCQSLSNTAPLSEKSQIRAVAPIPLAPESFTRPYDAFLNL